jgi:16S rRNA processing protein RimM
VVSLQPGSIVYLGDRPHTVRAVRRVDRGFQVAFEDVHDRETAEEIRGLEVLVEDRRPLGDDEFWPEDLVGLPVFDGTGRDLGFVEGVVLGAAQDRLRIARPDGHVFEVPFVDALVPVVDLEKGRVEIDSIEGLIDPV